MQWRGAGRRGGEELCGISVKSHVQTPLSFVISSGSSGPSFLTTLAVEQSERSEEYNAEVNQVVTLGTIQNFTYICLSITLFSLG